MPYYEVIKKIKKSVEFAIESWIRVKITDIPFCFLPDESWIKYTDDYDYEWRTKLMYHWWEFTRKWAEERIWDLKDVLDKNNDDHHWKEQINSRMRKYVKECENCKYLWLCWWIAECYDYIYKEQKINPII